MGKIQFVDKDGTFTIERPENYSGLYFPLAGEQGLKVALASNFGGDSKLNQNAFLLEPVSIDNLHNNRSTRNFWCVLEEGLWSAMGQSAGQEADKFTQAQDESCLTAGFMWQCVTRNSKVYGLSSKVTSFVPVDLNVEIMEVTIQNESDREITFTPVAAIPIYGRSADNIRDHRHVTSLLHRIRTTEEGVYVRPTLSFDERGHQKNNLTYYVCGKTAGGENPVQFYPVVSDYIGEGGTFLRPRALVENIEGVSPGHQAEGKEALGGLVFEQVCLKPGQQACYILMIGVEEEEKNIDEVISRFCSKELVEQELEATKKYWNDKVNVSYHSGEKSFDSYMRWVSFQPILRRIYGCSFLPHHDYGKGGRGWRDLWQDCLALLMMNPQGVRQMILDNFCGVRVDGSNATIIGTGQGEFIADRNGITRVWMDHGVWPFLTTKLYMNQTGDLDILNQKVSYFKDGQVERGTAIDQDWTIESGNRQLDVLGNEYQGTVLEHLLLQNLCAFYEVGKHNHIRLRGADWNDALDMAEANGESVAFTCAYAGNLKQLASYIRLLKRSYNQQTVELMEEAMVLLGNDSYDDIDKKLSVLHRFEMLCRHRISGAKVTLDAEVLANNLEQKAEWMMQHIRKTEWVTDQEGRGWFNSYYDNHGAQVEGVFESGVRMMLTGQVFALMSKTASPLQMQKIVESVKAYLFDPEIGGYRINTNFHEEKYDMGRMFGFAYGEKENGAVFSHMAVMYANALYQNGFVREGYEALKALSDASMNFEQSRMYPGIPEYFNNEGRGLYAYLTGAASWYMMTIITEAYGISGELGKLVIEPKLVAEQFDEMGYASIRMMFADKEIEVIYYNPMHLDYGQYHITGLSLETGNHFEGGRKAVIDRASVKALSDGKITVVLGQE